MLVILRGIERLQGIGIALNAADIFRWAGVFARNEIGGYGVFLSVFFFAGGDAGQGDEE